MINIKNKPKTKNKKTKINQSHGKQITPPREKRRKAKTKNAQTSLLHILIALGILFVLVCIWHLKK
ncbi:MAG: hypothetical protein EAZ85_02910 [Bacteroidetes bacterium]|nr:MAG: hypothetical protein EAZ85_02910 [Bacteroidota bacterium]TAG85369.1 MAG: hypothetical protein EAZ20_15310 [Bacteroidota bacterium]